MAIQSKGAQFERETCVRLSLWVSGGKEKDLFWRTAMSGGRATVHKKKGSRTRQVGDVCAVAPEGHPFTNRFYVELKFYKNLELTAFFTKNSGNLKRFWDVCCREADSYDRKPLLIARQNRIPTLLLFRDGDLPARWLRITHDYSICMAHAGCQIVKFDDFLLSRYAPRI